MIVDIQVIIVFPLCDWWTCLTISLENRESATCGLTHSFTRATPPPTLARETLNKWVSTAFSRRTSATASASFWASARYAVLLQLGIPATALLSSESIVWLSNPNIISIGCKSWLGHCSPCTPRWQRRWGLQVTFTCKRRHGFLQGKSPRRSGCQGCYYTWSAKEVLLSLSIVSAFYLRFVQRFLSWLEWCKTHIYLTAPLVPAPMCPRAKCAHAHVSVID